jgi:hypothetical protein
MDQRSQRAVADEPIMRARHRLSIDSDARKADETLGVTAARERWRILSFIGGHYA